MPVHVWAAGALVVIAVVVLLRALVNKLPSKRPPIFEEVPFIGGLLGFIDSPIKLARRGYDALGEVSPRARFQTTLRCSAESLGARPQQSKITNC